MRGGVERKAQELFKHREAVRSRQTRSPSGRGRRIVTCPVTWRMGIFRAQPPSRALRAPWRARRPKFVLWLLGKQRTLPHRGYLVWAPSSDRDGDLDGDRAEREWPASQPVRRVGHSAGCVSLSREILLAGLCLDILSWHSIILHGVHNCLSNAGVAGNMAGRHRGTCGILALTRQRERRLDDLDGLP